MKKSWAQNLILRRAVWLLGMGGIAVFSVGILYFCYGLIFQAAADRFDLAAQLYEFSKFKGSTITIYDIAKLILRGAFDVVLGLALGAFGIWLPYHAWFGKHNDKWPRSIQD